MLTQTNTYNEVINAFCMMDDEFMTKMFENNIPCTELLLQIILEDDKIKVKQATTQVSYKNLQGHDLKLDILAEKHDGTLFNVEVQNQNEGAIAQRARYHASLLDSNNLPKGKDYKALPDSYVIFITRNDIFQGNLPIYHVERVICENSKFFADGSHIIYVNNKIQDSTPLGQLMHDFSCKEPEDMHYSLLAERATYFKKNEKGREEMSEVMERFAEQVAQQAAYQKTVKIAKGLLADGMSIDFTVRHTDLPLEEVQKLAEQRSA